MTAPHNGIILQLEGLLKAQLNMRAIGAMEPSSPQIPPENLCSMRQVLLPPGKFEEYNKDIPFEIQPTPITGRELLESYTGVYLSVAVACI